MIPDPSTIRADIDQMLAAYAPTVEGVGKFHLMCQEAGLPPEVADPLTLEMAFSMFGFGCDGECETVQ